MAKTRRRCPTPVNTKYELHRNLVNKLDLYEKARDWVNSLSDPNPDQIAWRSFADVRISQLQFALK